MILLGEFIVVAFSAILGGSAVWAAASNYEPVFLLPKIAYFDGRLGRRAARLIVGSAGLLLLGLAVSLIAAPPA